MGAVRITEQTLSHVVYHHEQNPEKSLSPTCSEPNSYEFFAYDFIPNSRWELFSLLDISHGPLIPDRLDMWRYVMPLILDYYGLEKGTKGQDFENSAHPELRQC